VDAEDFRRQVLEFLRASAEPRRKESDTVWGEGSDRVGLFRELTPEQELAELDAAKRWRRTLADAGYAWISGPTEYGGAGLPRSLERLYAALEIAFDTPAQDMLGIGLNMVGPTILAHGSDEAKARYLPGMRCADLVACQLFSEPGAGSDLASVTTSARQHDGAWTISGAKVWTSHARHADIGLVLCRTDPSVSKHAGMTAFIVDMHAPGVEVRPLRQMTGGATFNSVTLDEVLVPDSDRVGVIGEGWTVARTTLLNERASIGNSGRRDQLSTAKLIDLVQHSGRSRDDVVRQHFARLYIRTKAVSMTGRRAAATARAGVSGPEASVLKLSRSANLRLLSDLLGEVLGERLVADTGEWGTFAWSELVLGVPGTRLGGGTDEIQKNVIGERVLGLPKEPAAAGRAPADRKAAR
jgi:alkylation response protein AidB-like acyl-CoA dehydrogenase